MSPSLMFETRPPPFDEYHSSWKPMYTLFSSPGSTPIVWSYPHWQPSSCPPAFAAPVIVDHVAPPSVDLNMPPKFLGGVQLGNAQAAVDCASAYIVWPLTVVLCANDRKPRPARLGAPVCVAPQRLLVAGNVWPPSVETKMPCPETAA